MKFKSLKSPGAVLISGTLFLLLAIPTIAIGGHYYEIFNAKMTSDVFTQRQTVASLSATAIQIKIEQLATISMDIAQNPSISNELEHGNWVGAKDNVKKLLDTSSNYNFYIDRAIFLDTSGTIQSAFPAVSTRTIGMPTWA